ncbi:MAG: type II secretion system F family protein [Planctomycetaceae bacterium]
MTETQPPPEPPHRHGSSLGAEDFTEAVGRVATVTRSGLPLEAGLRAIGEEAPSHRLRAALRTMAEHIEAGASIEEALDHSARFVPDHLRGLVRAGVRSGRLGLLLEDYVTRSRLAADRRRRVAVAMTYPVLLCAVTLLITVFYLTWVVPQFRDVFDNFGIELPPPTLVLLTVSEVCLRYGWWILLGLLALPVVLWLLVTVLGGSSLQRRLVHRVPFVGPLLQFAGLAEFCHLLSLFVEHRTPLPEALRLTASAIRDPYLRRGCREMADRVEHGLPPAEAAFELRQFPETLLHVFRHADRQETFAEALAAHGDIYDARSRVQSALVGTVVEPIIVVLTATLIGFIFAALLAPMVKLLNDLS